MKELIMPFLDGSTAQLTFISFFLAGLTFTFITMIFGHDGDADHEGDVGFDHDGDLDHEADHDSGGGPGFFSVRSIAIMVTAFGGVGFLIQKYTGNTLFASAGGVLSSWVFAAGFLAILRLAYRQQASSLATKADFKRAQGMVTTTIPATGSGEVSISVAGKARSSRALSASGKEIAQGTQIKVVQYMGGTVTVEPI